MNIYLQSNSAELQLSKAYLVYEKQTGYSAGQNGVGFVGYISQHNVLHEEGKKPRILPGTALDERGLTLALEQLARAQGVNTMTWADDSTVASSSRINVWWSKAQKRWMHFKSHGLEMSMPANNPPLVWLRADGQLYVFAIKEDVRPGPDTPLFHSPYYNVYAKGNVCLGSMQRPSDLNSKAWEESFFCSTFTHTNNGRLTTYKKGDAALWKHLMTSKKNPVFPLDVLRPLNKTLGEVIAEITK